MLLPLIRQRAITALAGTPDVLDALLGGVDAADPIWDKRPDPERFTLREILAHLAEYEVFWHGRIVRTLNEDLPLLTRSDPGRLAIENNYAAIDPLVSLRAIKDRRPKLTSMLHDIQTEDWVRPSQWGDLGQLTLEEQVAFVVIHDGYHTSQIAQWLRILRA